MFLTSYQHLHPLSKAKSYFVEQNDEDDNLVIFEMVANTCELTKKLVN
jgi:hypothetical protein